MRGVFLLIIFSLLVVEAYDMLGHGLTGVGKSKDKITVTTVHLAEIMKIENEKK